MSSIASPIVRSVTVVSLIRIVDARRDGSVSLRRRWCKWAAAVFGATGESLTGRLSQSVHSSSARSVIMAGRFVKREQLKSDEVIEDRLGVD
jgi:hypothetical protein